MNRPDLDVDVIFVCALLSTVTDYRFGGEDSTCQTSRERKIQMTSCTILFPDRLWYTGSTLLLVSSSAKHDDGGLSCKVK